MLRKFALVIFPHILSDIVMTLIHSPSFCYICRPITKYSWLNSSRLCGEIPLCELQVKKGLWIVSPNEVVNCTQCNGKLGLNVHIVLEQNLEDVGLVF